MAKTKKAQTTNKRAGGKTVETIRHTGATRKNIPSAEHQSVLEKTEAAPRPVKYLRNTDLDPQLVWRGKDEQDWTDLVVQAPPLYIQDRVHPKLLVDDLLRQSRQTQEQAAGRAVRPLRRLQRDSRGCGPDRVLPARPELVEPDDPG